MAGGFTRLEGGVNFVVQPVAIQSLKEVVIQTLESWILSGELVIGEKLPSERDLAQKMKISRPVLHEALVDLASKGLVKIEARRGIFVNDYRTHGSCALLSSLLNFHQSEIDPVFEKSLIEMRQLVEVETAKLAAIDAQDEDITALKAIIESEKSIDSLSIDDLVTLDFNFHLQIALASGNRVYPLILNSFKAIYTHLTTKFFTRYFQSAVIKEVISYHNQLYQAIIHHNAQLAQEIMKTMLIHGENYLTGGSNDN